MQRQNRTKRIFAGAIIALAVFILSAPMVTVSAFAAPSAEPTMVITDAEYDGDDVLFTVSIAVSAPAAPYASLDFNLVSSDPEHLSVVNLNGNEDEPELDITFLKGFGSAYHRGRIDAEAGSCSYLIGIYSQSSGNKITDAVEVCTVRLRYSGDETQTLKISDMKLVYLDDVGGVASAQVDSEAAALEIDEGIVAQMNESAVPLQHAANVMSPMVFIVPLIILIAAALAFRIRFRRRRRAQQDAV
jgi:hypothetical protein